MKIALLGCGVVGGGVLEIIDKRCDMELKYVLVRRAKPELGDRAVSDFNIIINDKEIDTVVEAMGGLSRIRVRLRRNACGQELRHRKQAPCRTLL